MLEALKIIMKDEDMQHPHGPGSDEMQLFPLQWQEKTDCAVTVLVQARKNVCAADFYQVPHVEGN